MRYPALIFLFFLTSCASAPEDLGTAFVSPAQYINYDCDQIAASLTSKNKRLNKLYISLKNESTADNWQMGIGMLVAWPALFFVEGGDGAEAEEYRQLKGETEALQEASIQKKCGFSRSPRN